MSLLDELNHMLDSGMAAIKVAADHAKLEEARIKYLGRNGELKELMNKLKETPAELKAAAGKLANEAKNALSQAFDEAKAGLEAGGGAAHAKGPLPDPTLPGTAQPRGTRHPLTQTVERIASIFERIGFTLVDGPEIEDDFHNFTALNVPADHPARDAFDTFFIDGGGILRSQTSTVQVRIMEKAKPPVRVIAPGRVYRPDAVDATHFYSFHQIEGLAVDEGVSFADLKGLLDLWAKEMFGSSTATRFRPSFFPFTEPSAEMDVSCYFCGGKGCRTCKSSGWIEVLGCGMVDPNVFDAVGIDKEKYTGFAFGMGTERVAMLSLGINDVRLFTENDLRFLRQF